MKPSEAIANIEYARKWLGSESDFSDEALDMAISALEKQEQDRWIPVTERLPEKSGTYLITENNHIKDKNVCSAMYHITDIYGCYWSGGDCGIGKVLAWRPLPEAYMEEE